jgi:tetratricopeptide (TPR) repeat protein
MILDSADDRNVLYGPMSDDTPNGRSFATYLPQNRNGSILVTTRNKDLAFRLTGYHQNIIEVGPMSQTDALTLVGNKLGSLPDLDVAADLVDALDLVPLAISQAAAYIRARAPRTSPSKYLADFRASEKKKSKLLEHDAGDLRRDGGSPNAILATWQISFDHIRLERPSAADLLSLMSFFDRQGIPAWVLRPSEHDKDGTRRAGKGRFGDSSSATDDDSDDSGFEDDVAMLMNYCLIVADETGGEFEMHGLVQLSTRRWLRAFGQHDTCKQRCIERLAAVFPTGRYEDWATCGSLFAHVQVVSGYLPRENTAETWATLLHNAGWYAKSQGRHDVAQQMAYKSWEVRNRKLGKEHEVTQESIILFASILSARGRWEEAEKLGVRVLEMSKRKFGANHLVTIMSMDTLASIYRNQGRLKEAESLELQMMEARKITIRANHPDTLASMNNLAATYLGQGRFDDAEALLLQVIETRKKQSGPDHPHTLSSIANLASVYLGQGRLEESEKLVVQVLEAHKAKYGVDHDVTLSSMSNLALTWRYQGRHLDALRLMRDCVEAQQRVLGATHPKTLWGLATLKRWSGSNVGLCSFPSNSLVQGLFYGAMPIRTDA